MNNQIGFQGEIQRHLHEAHRHRCHPSGTRQMILPFEDDRDFSLNPRGKVVQLSSQIQVAGFLPLGLWMRGATDDTRIVQIQVGNCIQSPAFGRIPARYFETDRSFEELARLAERGEIEPLPRQIVEMDVASCGNTVRLDVEGPFREACFWGLVADRGARDRVILVERQERSRDGAPAEVSFRGIVLEEGMRGKRVVLDVTSPTEEGVARLINGQNKGLYG